MCRGKHPEQTHTPCPLSTPPVVITHRVESGEPDASQFTRYTFLWKYNYGMYVSTIVHIGNFFNQKILIQMWTKIQENTYILFLRVAFAGSVFWDQPEYQRNGQSDIPVTSVRNVRLYTLCLEMTFGSGVAAGITVVHRHHGCVYTRNLPVTYFLPWMEQAAATGADSMLNSDWGQKAHAPLLGSITLSSFVKPILNRFWCNTTHCEAWNLLYKII